LSEILSAIGVVGGGQADPKVIGIEGQGDGRAKTKTLTKMVTMTAGGRRNETGMGNLVKTVTVTEKEQITIAGGSKYVNHKFAKAYV
jgi:hypothetical protein